MTATASPPGLRVAGAAAGWVAELLEGSPSPARVLHSGRDAVYLDVRGTCVGVLSSGAALVPCGVRTSLTVLPTVAAGTDVTAGLGGVALPGCRVEVAATVATAVGRLSRDGVRRARDRAAVLITENGERLDAVRAALPEEALDALAAGRPTSTTGLLGCGPGLTPVG